MAKPKTYDEIKRGLSEGKCFGKLDMVQNRTSIPVTDKYMDHPRVSEALPQFQNDQQAKGYMNMTPAGWLRGTDGATRASHVKITKRER